MTRIVPKVKEKPSPSMLVIFTYNKYCKWCDEKLLNQQESFCSTECQDEYMFSKTGTYSLRFVDSYLKRRIR